MRLQRELAGKIHGQLAGGGRIDNADPYATVLHELIHGIMPEGQTPAMHEDAYKEHRANASIEEGFTELGAVQHAPEFFRGLGIGDRPAGTVSAKDGHVVSNPDYRRKRADFISAMMYAFSDLSLLAGRLRREGKAPDWDAVGARSRAEHDMEDDNPDGAREFIALLRRAGLAGAADGMAARLRDLEATPMDDHATLGQYAERLRDPQRIAKGEAWGHYGWQTSAAQQWALDAARAEGQGPASTRVRELADEVNREGSAGKVPAMLRQVIRAAGADPRRFHGTQLAALEALIREQWAQGPAGAQSSPWASAIAAVRQYEREH